MKHLLLYIHGFLSSNEPENLVVLRQYIAEHSLDIDIVAPQLPDNPVLAVNTIERIIKAEQGARASIGLLGHSLGGYFATYIASKYQLKAVLLNPVVRGYDIMCEFFGPCYNPHTDVHFNIGEQDIEYLASIYLSTLENHKLFFVLQQLDDEITDPIEVVDYYRGSRLIVEDGGCHDFSHFENHLESVTTFLFGS